MRRSGLCGSMRSRRRELVEVCSLKTAQSCSELLLLVPQLCCSLLCNAPPPLLLDTSLLPVKRRKLSRTFVDIADTGCCSVSLCRFLCTEKAPKRTARISGQISCTSRQLRWRRPGCLAPQHCRCYCAPAFALHVGRQASCLSQRTGVQQHTRKFQQDVAPTFLLRHNAVWCGR